MMVDTSFLICLAGIEVIMKNTGSRLVITCEYLESIGCAATKHILPSGSFDGYTFQLEKLPTGIGSASAALAPKTAAAVASKRRRFIVIVPAIDLRLPRLDK